MNKPRKQTVAQARKADATAKKQTKRVREMSSSERKKLIKELNKELLPFAPSVEVAESDLLQLLLLVGAEFIARYFPDATAASLHVSKREGNGPPLYSTVISLAAPALATAGARQ